MRLDRLSPARQARYNSAQSKETRRRKCSPGTRMTILADLHSWANAIDSAKIYWMNGMAGTGKTTIACSFCDALENACQLGASFFCSRLLPDCRDVTRIISTLAYQLASFSYPFQSALCDILGNDRDIGTYDADTQFDKLIREPLLRIKETIPTNLVIVIDALDECSDSNDTRSILDMLFSYAAGLPIKFFVTSRPEPAITRKMLSHDGRSRSILTLHDIERSFVQADIELYLFSELAAISPSVDQVRRLAERAGNLFIYAATAVRYICPNSPSVNSNERFEIMLEITSNRSSRKYKEIDGLYTNILAAALEDQELELWEVENIKHILHSIICIKEPMTANTLAGLLELGHERNVLSALEPLRSVLDISSGSNFIFALHASFPDYMLDHGRSGRFCCNEVQHHQLLAIRCFNTMRNSLRFNICSLESSYIPDKAVPDLQNRINKFISPQLFYACLYWGDHLQFVESSDTVSALLDDFLSTRLLLWIEVLNLKKRIGTGDIVLSRVYGWSEVSH
jgi:hypothetical protein